MTEGVRAHFITSRIDPSNRRGMLLGNPAEAEEGRAHTLVDEQRQHAIHVAIDPGLPCAPAGDVFARWIVEHVEPVFHIESENIHRRAPKPKGIVALHR